MRHYDILNYYYVLAKRMLKYYRVSWCAGDQVVVVRAAGMAGSDPGLGRTADPDGRL